MRGGGFRRNRRPDGAGRAETACYLCYTMRSVALARDPEEDFNFQQFLDSRRTDDGDKRESLAFSAELVASLAGLRNTEIADRGQIARD